MMAMAAEKYTISPEASLKMLERQSLPLYPYLRCEEVQRKETDFVLSNDVCLLVNQTIDE